VLCVCRCYLLAFSCEGAAGLLTVLSDPVCVRNLDVLSITQSPSNVRHDMYSHVVKLCLLTDMLVLCCVCAGSLVRQCVCNTTASVFDKAIPERHGSCTYAAFFLVCFLQCAGVCVRLAMAASPRLWIHTPSVLERQREETL
jgi:hypothetical protein